jgi:hypothetical protein
MDRIEVPQPTSRTILSLKRCLFCTMAFMYERVRTSSFWDSLVQHSRGEHAVAGTHQHFFMDALEFWLASFRVICYILGIPW